MFVLSAAWMMGAVEPSPQAPVIDFTLTPRVIRMPDNDLPRGIIAGKPGGTVSGVYEGGPSPILPVKMTLTTISPERCGEGEELVYEVEMTNTGTAPLVLPWSVVEEEAELESVPAAYRRMTLSLMPHGPVTGSRVAGPVSLAVGSDLSAGSLRTVASGERMLLRALGRCPGLDGTTRVGRTRFEGVASVYAFLSIQTKPTMIKAGFRSAIEASARSAPVALTVVKSTGERPPGH